LFYRIANWTNIYENNRSRAIVATEWVPIPNKFGDGYLSMVAGADGALAYAGWIGMVLVASKCTPRGLLIQTTGKPHTIESVAVKCHLPVECVRLAVKRGLEIGWLEETDACVKPAGIRQEGDADGAVIRQAPSDQEDGTGNKSTNERGREGETVRVTFQQIAEAAEIRQLATADIPNDIPDWWESVKHAMDGWSVAVRQRPLVASSNEPQSVLAALRGLATGPPIAGKPRSDYFAKAITELWQAGTPWNGRGTAYVVKCIKNKIEDWSEHGIPSGTGNGGNRGKQSKTDERRAARAASEFGERVEIPLL
jgi:hypothetical protein